MLMMMMYYKCRCLAISPVVAEQQWFVDSFGKNPGFLPERWRLKYLVTQWINTFSVSSHIYSDQSGSSDLPSISGRSAHSIRSSDAISVLSTTRGFEHSCPKYLLKGYPAMQSAYGNFEWNCRICILQTGQFDYYVPRLVRILLRYLLALEWELERFNYSSSAPEGPCQFLRALIC